MKDLKNNQKEEWLKGLFCPNCNHFYKTVSEVIVPEKCPVCGEKHNSFYNVPAFTTKEYRIVKEKTGLFNLFTKNKIELR